MATRDGEDTLESWLNKATDPSNTEDRWDCIQAFYELVNQESDGPQVATRLLAHKIQSPQEKEALQALTVLEACMNNCGKRFHSEAAKFRFLNELIKVLSPKYLGLWSPEKAKDRVIEIFYSWTLWLKDEPKIREAYSMLKKQGVVKKDPKLPDTIVMPPPPQRTTESVFDQEDKAQMLAILLKSTRPEDLQTANRLIKNTIREEQEKAERVERRVSTLEEVGTLTKQLLEQLDQCSASGDPAQQREDLKALYERCDRMRPSLFRLASDTVDDDSALAQVLAANDELTLAVNTYKEKVGRKDSNSGGVCGREDDSGDKNNVTPVPRSPREIKSYHLIDLSVFDSPQANATPRLNTPRNGSADSPLGSSLDHAGCPKEELLDLGLDSLILKPSQTQETTKTCYEELMQLSRLELNDGGPPGEGGIILRARGCASSHWTDTWSVAQKWSPTSQRQVFVSPVRLEGNLNPPHSLANIYVPLETIRPSGLEPITVYDQGGVHVSLHFAKDPSPGDRGVAVVIISTVNTSALHVRDLLFQAAVPKTMSVKLQPSSKTSLPPYNPLFPPAAISQVLLLANPHKCKVRLRYKLSFLHGEQQLSETGEIEAFPEWVVLVGS